MKDRSSGTVIIVDYLATALLEQRTWETRTELANTIFEWTARWCTLERRHSSMGVLSPLTSETLPTPTAQDG